MRATLIQLSLLGLTTLPSYTAGSVIHQQPFQLQVPLDAVSDLPSSTTTTGQRQRYDDQQVWRVGWEARNASARKEVMTFIHSLDLDIWHTTRSSIDVRVSAQELSLLQSNLPDSTFDTFIPNLQELVDLSFSSSSDSVLSVHPALQLQEGDSEDGSDSEDEPDLDASRKKNKKHKKKKNKDKKKKKNPTPAPNPIDPFNLTTLDTPYHDAFHPIEDVYKFGEVLIETFNGKHGVEIKEVDIGTTFEGRQIKGWSAKMSTPNGTVPEPSPQPEPTEARYKRSRKGEEIEDALELEFVVQSGQHGREWVGPSSALYFLHSLLLRATSAPSGDAATLLQSFRFTVIPNINPDGYTYSREHSRMWRKNRQDVGSKNGKCVGIDLNSNWGYKWRDSNRAGPCSEDFPGREAFEAYETKAVSEYLQSAESRGNRIRAFVDLHSYGQLFMFPFAHSCDDFPPDAEMLMEAGLGVAKAMRTQQGQGYEAGQACDLTYRAPGDAIDYTYGITDIRWSYSAELRDTGTYGFMLPPSLIRPTADEVTAGLQYLAKFIYVLEVNPPQTPRLHN